MTALEQAFPQLSHGLWLGFLVFLRIGALLTALPGLGEQWLSVRIRLVLAGLLTAAVMPAVEPFFPEAEPALEVFMPALLTETVSGLLLGLTLRLFVFALQMAGTIAAQATSLSQLLGNSTSEPLPSIGHILTSAALALLMLTGFHVKAAVFLILSYEILPPLTWPSPGAIAEAGQAEVARSFALAFTLAAPFVILSALYNLTLGFINKAMPQLMVAFVGAPAITFGAIALLGLAAPLLLAVWLDRVDAFLSNPFW